METAAEKAAREKKEAEEKSNLSPELKKLFEEQAAANLKFQQEMQETIKLTQNQNSQFLREALEGIKTSVTPPKQEEKLSDDDIEDMSQTQLVNHMLSEVGKMFEGSKTELDGKIEKVNSETNKERAERIVSEFKRDHEDFDEWKPELKEIINATPGLSLGDAYLLARQKNPEKASEMDEKYPPASGKGSNEEDSGNENEGRGKFGGMKPGSENNSEKKSDMTKEEASDDAWTETFGNISDLSELGN